MEVGSRVVRGPDWMWGDQDEGEGNVGTVVQHGQDRNLPDGTVLVHWDSGRQANYRAGHSGKFDLRILDSAQAGVKHTFITCDGCKQSPLAGTRWKCADCPNYDLCSPCFMNDVHNMHHSFLRFDISRGDGIPVGKRSNFTKQQSRGLFPGARVTRGRDWIWGDQDGGGGRVGQLTEITSWNGVERAGANVMWSLLSRNTYRTGHMGEVDLKCLTSAIGPPYYRECLAKLGENRRRLDSSRLRVGDRVSVCLDAEVLRAMSAGHGGWVDDMAEYIGKVGKISRIDADGDVHISYGLISWVFHPQAVTKVPSFQVGDKVRILSDKQLVKNLQRGHGGWNEEMTMALGKEGKILEVDSDGDAVVSVDSDLWLFNPAALEDMSAVGEATSSRVDTSPTSKVDPATDLLRMLLLEAVTSKGGSVDPGDRLVNASSNGNLQEVREILEAHPGKIDHKRGGKTALHVACHQGRKEIVHYLLGKGADKDIKDEQDYSALHHAAYGDRSGETVTAMLNIGTNVNVSDDKSKRTPLHLAVNQGNDAGVRSLLASRHCDVNCQDLAGDTPLHDAISKGNNAIVELILRSELLEISVCNSRGFNPLHQACMKGNLHGVQKIIEKYPDLIETPKEDGFTALHLAAFNNHLDIARCLLLSGHCDINLRNNKRQTALALAVSEAYTAMIELLVEHGADVNADDEDGDTPLHLAIIHQAVGTTGLRGLLQGLGLNLPAGAETDQHTGSAIAVYLVLHGANVSLCNHEGKTPLDLCQDTQTAALIQQVARNAPSSVPRPPIARTTGPSSSKPPVPPLPSAARLASGAAVQRQKKTQDTANRAEAAGTDCIICSENVATVTFKPCGHKVTCSVCSIKLKRCLKCNAAIQQKTSTEGGLVSTSTLMDKTDYNERIRLLESQLQAREDAIQCRICMERDKNVVFLCGHGACKECSERLKDCHICRQKIESCIPLHLTSESFNPTAKNLRSSSPEMSQREEELWNEFLQAIRDCDEDTVGKSLLETRNLNLGGGKTKFLTRKITTTQGTLTALHLAVENGTETIIKLLFENGVNVNATSQPHKFTALHMAIDQDNNGIIQLLLSQKDINVNACDEYGQTPLKLAAEKGNQQTVKWLIEKGADITKADSVDNTAIHVAADKGHYGVLQLLLLSEAFAKNPGIIDKQNKDKNTPLHLAVARECQNSVALLLCSGAVSSLELENRHNKTPKQLAKGNKVILALLENPLKAKEHLMELTRPGFKVIGQGGSVEAKSECFSTVKPLDTAEWKKRLENVVTTAIDFEAKHKECVRVLPYSDDDHTKVQFYVFSGKSGVPQKLKDAAQESFGEMNMKLEWFDLYNDAMEILKVTPVEFPSGKPERLNESQIYEINEIINKNLHVLVKHRNVTAVQASFKITNSKQTKQPCIAIYVLGKGSIPVGEFELPRTLGDYNVDVVDGFWFRTGKDDPWEPKKGQVQREVLRLGASIGVRGEKGCGTLGAIVESDGNFYALSCDHVMKHPQREIIHPAQDDYLNHLNYHLQEYAKQIHYIIKREQRYIQKAQLSFGILEEVELLKKKFQEIKSIKEDHFDAQRAREETLEEVEWHERVLEKGFRTPPRVIGRCNFGISRNVEWTDNQQYFIDAAIAQLNSEEVDRLRNSDVPEMIGTKKFPSGRCSLRVTACGDLCKSGRTTEYTDSGRHAKPGMYLRETSYELNALNKNLVNIVKQVSLCQGCFEASGVQDDLRRISRPCSYCTEDRNTLRDSVWWKNCLCIDCPYDPATGERFSAEGDSGAVIFEIEEDGSLLGFGIIFAQQCHSYGPCTLASPLRPALETLSKEISENASLRLLSNYNDERL